MTAPRAVGVRTPYPAIPARVRTWVDGCLGSPVVGWEEQIGGFSPGCATRVVTADGTRAFVKAVGSELNADTPTLFRREIEVLGLIGADRLWATLRASYDADGWVALLLEDIEGGHPDLSDDAQMEQLLVAAEALGEQLSRVVLPSGQRAQEFAHPGLIDVRASFTRWLGAFEHLDEIPTELLPPLVRDRADHCRSLVAGLLEERDYRLTHWDIRNDNLLRRADGSLVFVDWGAAGVGPAWVDPLLARLERVDTPWFDLSVRRSPLLVAAGEQQVTGWLIGLGCYLAWRSTFAADPSLPTLNEFRRTEARRFLAGAVRRLDADLGG
ncbi:phosphotransferase [Nocardioides cynanchi]|uniref:phosphotransferase n=1 Tax=Nocardioides cynanchi TaxID=2558918 RepID=UPI001246C3CC|nr:phosphotransferase [Nocardioides cynanchi]